MIPEGGTRFILRQTLYHIFCQQNLLTKKKFFYRLGVAFFVKNKSVNNLKKGFVAQESQYHTCQLSRFRRETPDFEDFSRSPDLNKQSPDIMI